MADETVLFCPFCRESFEDERTCPEHELALVPFERLGPDPEDPASDPAVVDATPVGPMEAGYGRGWLLLGAAGNLASLGLVMVRGGTGERGVRGYQLAVALPSLWTLIAVSLVVLYVLRTRRTPRQMRSQRVLLPFLACVPLVCVGWVFFQLSGGAPLDALAGRDLAVEPGLGTLLVGLSSLCMLIGGLRFGVRRGG